MAFKPLLLMHTRRTHRCEPKKRTAKLAIRMIDAKEHLPQAVLRPNHIREN
jgi:hypothetical protein